MIDNSTHSYTIGFFTSGTDLEYSALLARIMTKVATSRQINLINFLGGSLNPNFTSSQDKYQYQCNVAFDFANTPHLDGIILASGILASFLNQTDYRNFYSHYKPLPMVSLGANIEDLPSVYTDNITVFNQLVSHLIQVHNCKKIGFISGPSSNIDGHDRYLGYMKALSENCITYQPDYVYVGDFTPLSAQEAIKVLIDERHLDLDAIVCANDSMALTAISELKKRNYLVPEQIIVTGCDDIPSSAYSVPNLTSIQQHLEDMVSEAINLLIKCIEGKPTQNVLIPSEIIYRESCSCRIMHYSSMMSALALAPRSERCIKLADNFLKKCTNTLPDGAIKALREFTISFYRLVIADTHEFETPTKLVNLFFTNLHPYLNSIHLVLNLRSCMTSLKKDLLRLSSSTVTLCYVDNIFDQITHELLNYSLNYYGLQNEHLHKNFSFLRQFLLTITHNIDNKQEQLQSIIPSLMDCGISSCLIYLYPEGIIHNLSDPWKMPDEIYLYMGYINNNIIPFVSLPYKVKSSDIATYGFIGLNEQYSACIHPIFFGNEQLGIMVFQMNIQNYSLIDNLTVELACALKLTSTFTTQLRVEEKLAALSQTDELTGLYNRRGFFTLAQEKYQISIAEGQDGVLFFTDMDGLKRINDTYGHHEGDEAIISMSKILKKTFSDEDILARIGGDEFVILCTGRTSRYIEEVVTQINKHCDAYNTCSDKLYSLSISVGGIFYSHDEAEPLDALMSRADKLLYEKKRMRKQQAKQASEKDQCDLL